MLRSDRSAGANADVFLDMPPNMHTPISRHWKSERKTYTSLPYARSRSLHIMLAVVIAEEAIPGEITGS